MAQTLIAIEVSRQHARIVDLTASMRKSNVNDAITIDLDPDADAVERWAEIRAELPRMPETLIVAVEGGSVSTRVLQFPFNDTKKIEAALDFEIESQIPYDLDDVVTSWTVTDRDPDGATVLTAITPRVRLMESLQAMSLSAFEPRTVALPAACLAELVPADNVDPVAVVSIGGEQTDLAVVRDGLRYARTIRTGGIAIDRVLAAHYKVSLDDARTAKENEGRLIIDTAVSDPQLVELSSQIEVGLRPLLRELVMTFRSIGSDDLPSKIYLTGGLSRLAGLAEYLALRLGIEVELVDLAAIADQLDPSSEPGANSVPLGPEYASVFALALAQLRRGGQVALNFRRGEFSYSGDFAVYRGEIVRIAVGLAAVLLIALIGSVVRLSVLSAEEDRIDQAFCETTKKITGNEICNPDRALAVLKEPSNSAGGVVIPTYSATDLLDTVSGLLSDETDVTFEDMELKVEGRADEPDQIVAKGEAASFESIEKIAATLKRDPCITEVEVSRQKRTRDSGRVEFNLEISIDCPAGARPGSTLAASE